MSEDAMSQWKDLSQPALVCLGAVCFAVLHVNGDGPEADSCYRAVSIRVDGTHQF